MNTKERLREVIQKLRRTPMPLEHLIPLLQEAADEIEELEYELKESRN